MDPSDQVIKDDVMTGTAGGAVNATQVQLNPT